MIEIARKGVGIGVGLSMLVALLVAASACAPRSDGSPPGMGADPTSGIEAPEAVPAPDPTGAVREGVDIVGFDLGQVDGSVDDPAACQQRCDEREGCVAWTLYPADGACWLKSGVERLHASVYAVSGLRSGGAWPSSLD